jgi:hypothetical protein
MSHNSPRWLAPVAITLSALSALAALPAAGQVINESTKLLPADGAAGDEFGRSVAITGTTAVVGAWRDDNNGPDSGSAYLFDTIIGQLVIAWTVHQPGVTHALVGARTREQAVENAAAGRIQLTPEDLAAMNTAVRGMGSEIV